MTIFRTLLHSTFQFSTSTSSRTSTSTSQWKPSHNHLSPCLCLLQGLELSSKPYSHSFRPFRPSHTPPMLKPSSPRVRISSSVPHSSNKRECQQGLSQQTAVLINIESRSSGKRYHTDFKPSKSSCSDSDFLISRQFKDEPPQPYYNFTTILDLLAKTRLEIIIPVIVKKTDTKHSWSSFLSLTAETSNCI